MHWVRDCPRTPPLRKRCSMPPNPARHDISRIRNVRTSSRRDAGRGSHLRPSGARRLRRARGARGRHMRRLPPRARPWRRCSCLSLAFNQGSIVEKKKNLTMKIHKETSHSVPHKRWDSDDDARTHPRERPRHPNTPPHSTCPAPPWIACLWRARRGVGGRIPCVPDLLICPHCHACVATWRNDGFFYPHTQPRDRCR